MGLPFGDGPEGVTCWGLVRRVYAERLGVALPEYGEISSADLIAVAKAMRTGAAAERWRAVAEPRELDVVLMSAHGHAAVAHVGVMVNAGGLLHAERATASVVVPLNHFSVRTRIRGFRRWVE